MSNKHIESRMVAGGLQMWKQRIDWERGMTWDGDSTMFCVHVVIDEVSLYSLYYVNSFDQNNFMTQNGCLLSIGNPSPVYV